mgnify:CR=1 FL=1
MGRATRNQLVKLCLVCFCGALPACNGEESVAFAPPKGDASLELTATHSDLTDENRAARQDLPPDHEVWVDQLDAVTLDVDFEVLPEVDSKLETTSPDLTGNSALGIISGSCGGLSELFAAASPALVVNTYEFADADGFDHSLLTTGAAKRYELDNEGGSSLCSEVMSIQLLEECDGALLLKTETEIDYATEGSIADFTATLDGERIGVSVTRAYKGPMGSEYTLDDATTLLTKKLSGLHQAALTVSPEDAWDHSLLHIWTLRPDWVPTLTAAWESLPPEAQETTVVMVTIEANSEWIVPEACKP